jgi:hypothetical protein
MGPPRTIAQHFKSRYQRIANTIVQLSRFDTFVFMNSAHANQFGVREGKLLRRILWVKPVLLQSEARRGVYKLIASESEATCWIRQSDPDTRLCGRQQVL